MRYKADSAKYTVSIYSPVIWEELNKLIITLLILILIRCIFIKANLSFILYYNICDLMCIFRIFAEHFPEFLRMLFIILRHPLFQFILK